MDAERTGICLVGCGRVAKSHLAGAKQAKDSVRVAALVSRDAKKGEQYAACCGDVPVFATLEEAAARCAFEAVDLCVPNDLHCEYALRSAALGKHILVEKPMANTPADCVRMEDAAKRAGVTLMSGQSRRYYPAVLRSYEMAESGRWGALRCISAQLLGYLPGPPTPWWRDAARTGGLMLPLWGNHIFDYILWMFGEMPQTVYCVATRLNPAWEGEDEVAATLSFAGGRFACVRMSWNTRGGKGEWEGTERMLSSADILYQRQIQLDHGTLMLDDETRLVCDGETVFVDEEKESNFARMLREFASAIRQGRPPLTDAAAGRRAVAVQEACLRSAAENRLMRLTREETYV